jgi:hypothetical protein
MKSSLKPYFLNPKNKNWTLTQSKYPLDLQQRKKIFRDLKPLLGKKNPFVQPSTYLDPYNPSRKNTLKSWPSPPLLIPSLWTNTTHGETHDDFRDYFIQWVANCQTSNKY